MKYLVKNNSFNNDVFVAFDKSTNSFSKFGFTEKTSIFIKNEIGGIKWYNNNFPNKINLNYQYLSKNYSKIEIEKINGTKINYYNNFSENIKYIEIFIDFYLKHWPKNNNTPIHGDLTFDNIFFSENKIIIFDWEHFDLKGSDYGYDLIYFILSSFFLPLIINKKSGNNDIFLFKKIWKKIENSMIGKDILYDPFIFFKTFYNKENSWINKAKPHKNKYLINILNNDIKNKFYNIIRENN